MDPTYHSLIMPRRKQSNRKGFLPAILAGLAGVKLVSQLGKSLMNRKSGYGLGQTITKGQTRRKGRTQGGWAPKNGLLGGTRKGRTMTKKMAATGLLGGTRKGLYLGQKKFPKLPPGMTGFAGTTRKKGVQRRKGFDRNKAILAKNIIKTHLLGRKSRKGKYSRRKGDVDADFLGEFGGDIFNPEKTVSKTWSRQAYDALTGIWGSKQAKIIKDKLQKQGEQALIDKISSLSSKKAQTIASKIIDGKPIPVALRKDLVPKSRFIGKYRG